MKQRLVESWKKQQQKKCPAGMFCTAGGSYAYTYSKECSYCGDDIEPYQIAPAELITENWGTWENTGLCSKCTHSKGKRDDGCQYCADEYDEGWVSLNFGFYLIKNGEVIYRAYTGPLPYSGAFPCPGTYPSSDEGASSLFECYRVVENGKKEYYKAPTVFSGSSNIDIGTVNSLVKDLQSALSKAQALQNLLNKSNQGNTTNIESVKTAISAGISDKMSIDNQKMASKPAKSDIEGAKALIRSGVTETHGAVKAAKRTHN